MTEGILMSAWWPTTTANKPPSTQQSSIANERDIDRRGGRRGEETTSCGQRRGRRTSGEERQRWIFENERNSEEILEVEEKCCFKQSNDVGKNTPRRIAIFKKKLCQVKMMLWIEPVVSSELPCWLLWFTMMIRGNSLEFGYDHGHFPTCCSIRMVSLANLWFFFVASKALRSLEKSVVYVVYKRTYSADCSKAQADYSMWIDDEF